MDYKKADAYFLQRILEEFQKEMFKKMDLDLIQENYHEEKKQNGFNILDWVSKELRNISDRIAKEKGELDVKLARFEEQLKMTKEELLKAHESREKMHAKMEDITELVHKLAIKMEGVTVKVAVICAVSSVVGGAIISIVLGIILKK